jgi:adenosylcobinamide amidohydrolase
MEVAATCACTTSKNKSARNVAEAVYAHTESRGAGVAIAKAPVYANTTGSDGDAVVVLSKNSCTF